MAAGDEPRRTANQDLAETASGAEREEQEQGSGEGMKTNGDIVAEQISAGGLQEGGVQAPEPGSMDEQIWMASSVNDAGPATSTEYATRTATTEKREVGEEGTGIEAAEEEAG